MSSDSSSYRVALKASTIIAGSSVIALVFNVLRAKGLAILLGPSGVGLFGTYGSLVLVVGTLAGVGIPTSGVRQVAEANAAENGHRLASVTAALRLNAIVLGLLGSLLLFFFSTPLSRITFSGTDRYAGALAFLSITVFLTLISQGQQAFLQGKRLIRELAITRIVAAAGGTAVTILIVWFLGESGIVVAMVATATVTVACTWWYAHREYPRSISVSRRDISTESAPLLRLGSVFMISSLMITGSMFLQRAIVIRQLGIEDAGFYQAAYALSVVYVGFILSAMSADFLPRLTTVSHDDVASNQIVNEQAEISLLFAAPGILATYALAPFVIPLFYSNEFMPAVEVLRWQILGVLGQVLTWPMGFILIAKGRSSVVFATNLAYALVHLILFWFAIPFFGLAGTGIAFALVHVYQWLILTKVSHHVSGFRWSRANKRLGILILFALCITALATRLFSPLLGIVAGSLVAAGAMYYSLARISALVQAPSIIAFCTNVLKKYAPIRGAKPDGQG